MRREVITGKELRFAAINKIPIYYEEIYFDYDDKSKDFAGECVLEKAKHGFYIGNSDIGINDFGDKEKVMGDFSEGIFKVYKIQGKKYKDK